MVPSIKSNLGLFTVNESARKKSIIILTIALIATVLLTSWSKLYNYVSGNHLAVTRHQIQLDNKTINYSTSAGYMSISKANVFYVDYIANNQSSTTRPITFVFNGGPGSASIWLHMGSFGPVRVQFKSDKGDAPVNNNQYRDNPNSWLGFTDLIFIDPVSTGYSRPHKGVDVRQFYGYKADISSIGEFIKLYLVQHNRQNSPKFLAGESYGSARAVGLAEYLQDNYNLEFDGITLISPALNYQLINFKKDNKTPYSYYLPSYAIAAQYHKRLSPELQQLSVEQLQAKAAAFAAGTYSKFLNSDNETKAFKSQVIDSLHYYTGLSKNYLISVNGKVPDKEFYKTLLQDEKLVIGGFDSRVTGTAEQPGDPSEINLRGLFTSAFKVYTNNDLKYHNDSAYNATTNVGQWNNDSHTVNGYLNISNTLKKLMIRNPNLKVNIASGYYDLATPVATVENMVENLGLSTNLHNNISMNYYQSGHMIYICELANIKFKNDAIKFYQAALK